MKYDTKRASTIADLNNPLTILLLKRGLAGPTFGDESGVRPTRDRSEIRSGYWFPANTPTGTLHRFHLTNHDPS
jgi:hypothetical protein